MEQPETEKTKKEIVIARQENFMEAYRANLFNVTKACLAAGIGRTTFYRWLNEDETDFNERLKIARDEHLDFIENALAISTICFCATPSL